MVTEQKTRNESQRPREKWGAYRSGDANLVPRTLFPGFGGGAGKRPGDEVVGTPTNELARIFRFIGWKKKFSFRILYVLISYYMYFVSKKVF